MRVLTLSFVLVSLLALSCARKQVQQVEVQEKTEYTQSQELQNKKALAVAALLRKNHREAVNEINEAKKINPADPEIYNIEGIVYFSLKQYDQAEGFYKKAIELKPDYAEARYNLCGLYLTTNNLDGAIEQCSKAASDVFYESRDKALTSLGVAYFRKGDVNKAMEYYRQSLEIHPAFAYTHNELGKLYMSVGKDLEAIDEFRKAINGNELYDEAHYNLGLVYLRVGKTELACKSFRKVVEISPETALGVNAKSYLTSICVEGMQISMGE